MTAAAATPWLPTAWESHWAPAPAATAAEPERASAVATPRAEPISRSRRGNGKPIGTQASIRVTLKAVPETMGSMCAREAASCGAANIHTPTVRAASPATPVTRVERVRAATVRFRERAARAGVSLAESTTPIQPVIVGDAHQAVACAEALERAGFLVTPIRPPTVPEGSARLRVTLSAAHADEDIDALVTALAEALA